MLKIGQNWGKIANYPPQCLTKIGTTGCHGGTNCRYGNNGLIKSRPSDLIPSSSLCHSFTTVTRLSIKFSRKPVGCHGGTSRRSGNHDVIKPWSIDFDLLMPFVPQFHHCHIIQHVTCDCLMDTCRESISHRISTI